MHVYSRKSLEFKTKKKLYTQLSWTSKAGMEDTLQNPPRLFSYISLRYLKLTAVGYREGLPVSSAGMLTLEGLRKPLCTV